MAQGALQTALDAVRDQSRDGPGNWSKGKYIARPDGHFLPPVPERSKDDAGLHRCLCDADEESEHQYVCIRRGVGSEKRARSKDSGGSCKDRRDVVVADQVEDDALKKGVADDCV